MLSLLLFLMINRITAATPKDDFCRRFEHQSTVIDDKLYIDGGTVNYKDFPSSHENHDSKLKFYCAGHYNLPQHKDPVI